MPPRERQRRNTKESTRRPKKKICIFCKDKADWVDYKDVNLLRRFLSDRAKIRARRVTGNCSQHQRDVAIAIKTARELALLPYVQRTSTERAGRGRRRRDEEAPPEVTEDTAAEETEGSEEEEDEGSEAEEAVV